MLDRQEGLTKTYNRFHAPEETATDIQKLRELHVEMDKAVAAAYGWTDLDLGHGFHETKQGLRFTISETARREVLGRLLKLNHERYAEEEKQGLHNKKGKGKKTATSRSRKKAEPANSPGLFPVEANEEEAEDDHNAGEQAETTDPGDDERAAEEPASSAPKAESRPPAIEEIDTDAVMAAFRQATRGRGSMEREELLKEISRLLGYQRLGQKVEEALRGHLRAAIRRKIIEPDGDLVRPGHSTMDQYDLEELRETICSVMRKGTNYERDGVIHAVARYLGFVRAKETVLAPIKSGINSAIRQGVLGYEGSVIWREQ